MANSINVPSNKKNKKIRSQKIISILDFCGIKKNDEDRAIYEYREKKKHTAGW